MQKAIDFRFRLRRSDKASAFYSAPSRSEDLPP
ncbi:hypothetical protein M2146_000376, partial [Lachnospiraceae bacterium PF1-22]